MFGRKRRRHNATAQRLFQAEVAADAHARAALADAVAEIGSTVSDGLQHSKDAQAATEAVLEHLWRKVLDREQELTRAVEEVVQACGLLAERIESEQVERRALADAMASLARQALPSPSVPSQQRVLGGSVFGTPPAAGDDEVVIIHDPPAGVLTPSIANGDIAEPAEQGLDLSEDVTGEVSAAVSCRFDDTWVDGFEVSELVRDGDAVRCRLRRSADGHVLPKLFDLADIRPAEHDGTRQPTRDGGWQLTL